MRRGFTLLEAAVTLVVITALIGLTAMFVRGANQDAERTAVLLRMNSVAAAMLDHLGAFGYLSPHPADWTTRPHDLEVLVYPETAGGADEVAVVVGESGTVALATYSERIGACYFATFTATTPLNLSAPTPSEDPCNPLDGLALEDDPVNLLPRP